MKAYQTAQFNRTIFQDYIVKYKCGNMIDSHDLPVC